MERCLCCVLLIAYYIIVQRLYQLQKMFADYHPSFQPYYSRKLMCMIPDWFLGGSLLIIMFMLLMCWQIYLNAMICFLNLGTNIPVDHFLNDLSLFQKCIRWLLDGKQFDICRFANKNILYPETTRKLIPDICEYAVLLSGNMMIKCIHNCA